MPNQTGPETPGSKAFTRRLRLDMLHLEHMRRQRRDEQPNKRPLLTLAEPEPTAELVLSGRGSGGGHEGPLSPAEEPESLGERLALRSGTEPESQPLVGYAERDPKDPAFAPAQPESLGAPNALRLS
jgi:hypothetical protein